MNRIEKKVAIRIHGGLGNQIFQFFYALCYTDYENIYKYFDYRYKHRFKLASEFIDAKDATGPVKLILSSRAIKLIEKLGIKKSQIDFGFILMDGYFQDHRLYQDVDKQLISNNVLKLRTRFRIDPKKNNGRKLYHLRLGDFFSTEQAKLMHAVSVLEKCSENSTLITTDDYIFEKNEELRTLLKQKKIYHANTEGFNASELIDFMSAFNEIDSNQSTLAFWAAILGAKKIKIHNENLDKLYRILNDK